MADAVLLLPHHLLPQRASSCAAPTRTGSTPSSGLGILPCRKTACTPSSPSERVKSGIRLRLARDHAGHNNLEFFGRPGLHRRCSPATKGEVEVQSQNVRFR
ncbi:hypothetical protein VPH35_094519 [Triticum aestivum]